MYFHLYYLYKNNNLIHFFLTIIKTFSKCEKLNKINFFIILDTIIRFNI